MSTHNQYRLHKHMHVFSSDNQELGQIAAVYEDSFQAHRGLFLSKSRYFPPDMIERVDGDNVYLRLSAAEAQQPLWEKRPDYEQHLGDPTQLFYDRGHGIHDPFDEAGS